MPEAQITIKGCKSKFHWNVKSLYDVSIDYEGNDLKNDLEKMNQIHTKIEKAIGEKIEGRWGRYGNSDSDQHSNSEATVTFIQQFLLGGVAFNL